MKRVLLALVLCAGSMTAATYTVEVLGTIDQAYRAWEGMPKVDLGSNIFSWSFSFESPIETGRIAFIHQAPSAGPGGPGGTGICAAPPKGERIYSDFEGCPANPPTPHGPPQLGEYNFTQSWLSGTVGLFDLDSLTVEGMDIEFQTHGMVPNLSAQYGELPRFNRPYSEWYMRATSLSQNGNEIEFGNGYLDASGTITSISIRESAAVPEPSTFLLSAPVLLGLWGYGRVRASRSAGRRSYEIPSA